MTFTLSWIDGSLGGTLIVATAAEALKEAKAKRLGGALELVVRDDTGEKLTTDQLRRIVNPYG